MRRDVKFKSRDKNTGRRGSINRVPSGCMKFFRQQKRAYEKAQMEHFLQTMDEDVLYSVNKNEAEDIWGWD